MSIRRALIIRLILPAATIGSIAAGIAVPIATAAAPATTTVAAPLATPNGIVSSW